MIEPAGGPANAAKQNAEGAPVEKQDLLEVVDRRIRELAGHPDPEVREAIEELLNGFDLVHRTGLTSLVKGIQTMAGEAFLNRLCGDTAIRLLLMSYDLIQVDRTIQAEEALDAVRAHLFAHGIEVELLEVVGGVVYLQVHGVEAAGASVDQVRADIEAALRREFLGFQQLEIGPRPRARTGPLVPLTSRSVRTPRFVRAVTLGDLSVSRLTSVVVDGESYLLTVIDGSEAPQDGIRAFRNQCGHSPLPLEHAALEGTKLICPWHGCQYDVVTGKRLDTTSEPSLHILPVRIEGQEVQVAVGTDETTRERHA